MSPSTTQGGDDAAQPHQQQPAGIKAALLTSKFTGVCWNKKNKRWQASINSGGKYLYLGSFVHEDDAARMFDMAAIKLRGKNTKTNFPYEEYLDDNGQLIENEALNSTIAVHEQLVLTQKMATAQALALAGLTKKPRSAGGAGSVAKRLTKANPACQGIISAHTAGAGGSAAANAAAGAAAVSVSAAGAAASMPPGMADLDPQMFGHATIAKHVMPEFDVPLLQQAAATAATNAVLYASQQQGHGSTGKMGHADVSGQRSYQLSQQQQLLQLREVMGQLNHETALNPNNSTQSSIGLLAPGVELAGTWPAAMLQQHQLAQQILLQQQRDTVLGSGPPGMSLHNRGTGAAAGRMAGMLEQQEETARATQLGSLQGFTKDNQLQQYHHTTASRNANSAAALTAQQQRQWPGIPIMQPPSSSMPPSLLQRSPQQQQQQQQQQLYDNWQLMSEQGAAAPAVHHATHAAVSQLDVGQEHHDGYLPYAGEQRQSGAAAGSAAHAAAGNEGSGSALSVVRLPNLAQHLPPGGQLELLMVAESGLVGVLYTMQEQQQPWGTALWDGTMWHNGGGFATEAAALQACEFSVKFARQLVHKAPNAQQQQQRHGARTAAAQEAAPAASGFAASAQHQLGSSIGDLKERSSLDELAAAAGQALDKLQQQHFEHLPGRLRHSGVEQVQQQQQHATQQQQWQKRKSSSSSYQKPHSQRHAPAFEQYARHDTIDAAAAAAEPVSSAAIAAAKAAAAAANGSGAPPAAELAAVALGPGATAELGFMPRASMKRPAAPHTYQQLGQQQLQQQHGLDDVDSLGSGFNSLLQMLASDEVRSTLPAASLKVLDSLKAWGVGLASSAGPAAANAAGPAAAAAPTAAAAGSGGGGMGAGAAAAGAEALMFNILGSSNAAAFGQEAHLFSQEAQGGNNNGGPAAAAAAASPTLNLCGSRHSALMQHHQQQQQQIAASPAAPAAPKGGGAAFDVFGAFGSTGGVAAALAAASEATPVTSAAATAAIADAGGSGGGAAVSSGLSQSLATPVSNAVSQPKRESLTFDQHSMRPAEAAAVAQRLLKAASLAGSCSAAEHASILQLGPVSVLGSSCNKEQQLPAAAAAAAGKLTADANLNGAELLSASTLKNLGAYLMSLAEHELQQQQQQKRQGSGNQQVQQPTKRQRRADGTAAEPNAQQQQQGEEDVRASAQLASANWATAAMPQPSPAVTHALSQRETTTDVTGFAAALTTAAAASGDVANSPRVLPSSASGSKVLAHRSLGVSRDQLPAEAPHSPEPMSHAGRTTAAATTVVDGTGNASVNSGSSSGASLAAAAAVVKAAAAAAALLDVAVSAPAAEQPAADVCMTAAATTDAAVEAETAAAAPSAAEPAAADAVLPQVPESLNNQLTEALADMLSQGVEVNVQHVLALLSQLPKQQ